MARSVQEIATALGAEAFGAVDLLVEGLAEPAAAGPGVLALAMSPAYAPGLQKGQARAAVVWPGADWQALGLKAAIVVPRARLAMARLTQLMDTPHDLPDFVHPSAIVHASAVLGPGVGIGPLTVVGPGARIGAGTQVAGQVSIGEGAVIGAGGLILPGVRIGRRVTIGDRVIVQPNAVIGSDGFSFVTETVSNVEKVRESLGAETLTPTDSTWHRIHSLGGVEIGDDVEVGANSAIDAGTIRPTRIGAGTKIDNLVQVAHNVIVGRDCLLCGQAAIAGSSVLGDRVVLGGRAGVVDNLSIGSDVVLAAGALALSNVPAGRVMMGSPATRMDVQIESYKALRRLPRLLRDLAARQKPVSKATESD